MKLTGGTEAGDRWACDTSVAIAALDPNHQAHAACRAVLIDRRPALAGHAAFEAHSVLTRLPVSLRLAPDVASEVLSSAFPEPCWLTPDQSTELRVELGELMISGGSVFDALVGRAAVSNGRVLLTRDRRAERVYRALGVTYEVVH